MSAMPDAGNEPPVCERIVPQHLAEMGSHGAVSSTGSGTRLLLQGVSASHYGVEKMLSMLGLRGTAVIGAFYIGCSSGLIALVIRLLASNHYLPHFDDAHPKFLEINTAVWTGITGMLGFLIVFRCQQAYGRYWAAMTDVHLMRADWLDACSIFISFGTVSPKQDQVQHFQQLIVRLFSLMHAGALLRMIEPGVNDDAVARMPILDPMCLDRDTVDAFFRSKHKVEVVNHWIQTLIVKAVKEEVIVVPPPIVSRAFQELSNGVVKYHDALKVKTIRFPTHYAQVCDCLLTIHWVMTPFLVSLWVNSPTLATLFTFLGVFSVWSLSRVAACIENPFSIHSFVDDSICMQKDVNKTLKLLLSSDVARMPTMPGLDSQALSNRTLNHVSLGAFVEATDWLDQLPKQPTANQVPANPHVQGVDASLAGRPRSVMEIAKERLVSPPGSRPLGRDLSAIEFMTENFLGLVADSTATRSAASRAPAQPAQSSDAAVGSGAGHWQAKNHTWIAASTGPRSEELAAACSASSLRAFVVSQSETAREAGSLPDGPAEPPSHCDDASNPV